MSRIGKQPIMIPNGVTATVSDKIVTVKGPKGTLMHSLHPSVSTEIKDGALTISVMNPEEKMQRALWGLTRALVANMVTGVTAGFEKKLELEGVGYRVELAGKNLKFALGFSHPVPFPAPEGITFSVDGNVITVSGSDKQLVGETAAQIRSLRKVEPYKGKGLRYQGEQVRRKEGKLVKGSE